MTTKVQTTSKVNRARPVRPPSGVAGPVAGDRAPDVGGLEGPGFSGSLFDLMRGPHWSLIAYEHTGPVLLDNADPNDLHVHRIGSGPVSPIADAKGERQGVVAGLVMVMVTFGSVILDFVGGAVLSSTTVVIKGETVNSAAGVFGCIAIASGAFVIAAVLAVVLLRSTRSRSSPVTA
ncbi:hypothetical protein [Spongiactinospora sp. 9N601]|uniref:hypothetical protein n=1 Tax=Spongiactinospora sp. 9N601 TaxID=3375149 RepID=UPI00379E4B1F